MVGEPRLHHYLPQCYLRGFLPAGQKKPKLTVLDLTERETFETNTRNVGAERDFNRTEGEDMSPVSVESSLSSFEMMVAHALRVVSERKSHADEHTFAVLMNLIALMAVRNPQVRRNWSDSLSQLCKMLLHVTHGTKERWEHAMRTIRASGVAPDGNVTYEESRAFLQSGEYKIQIPTDTHIFYEFHGVDAVLPCLANRGWTLITTSDGTGPFVTCDRPVGLWWTHPEKVPPSLRDYPGFEMRDTIVLVPVSSRIVIAGEFEEEDRVFGPNGELIANKQVVAGINSRIISFAVRWVYASDISFGFIDRATGELKPGSELFDCLRKRVR